MEHHVASLDALYDALDTASGGDTILLAAGRYTGFEYAGPGIDGGGDGAGAGVTIRSADPDDPAVFADTFRLSHVADLTIADVTFDAGRLAESYYHRWVQISDAADITLERVTQRGHIATDAEGADPYDPATTWLEPIAGYPFGIGMGIFRVDGFTLRDSDLGETKTGLTLRYVDDAVVDNVDIHHVRGGLHFAAVDGLSVTNSRFESLTPWLDTSDPAYDSKVHEHPDMIQFWTTEVDEGVRDITISDNVFRMPPGSSTQTIFGFVDNPALTAENFIITNNLIVNGHPNALRLGDVDGGFVAGNVLLPNGPDPEVGWTPRIQLTGSSRHFEVVDNAMVDWFNIDTLGQLTEDDLVARHIDVRGTTALSLDPGHPDYWGDVDIDALRTALRVDIDALAMALAGGPGDDMLVGSAGDDRILMRKGSDIAMGRLGADEFVIDWRYRDPGDAHNVTDLDFDEGDTLTVRFLGGGGTVRIDSMDALADYLNSPDADLTARDADGLSLRLNDGAGGTVDLRLEGVGDPFALPPVIVPGVKLVGGAGDDTLIGGAGDDTFLLRVGRDIATGGAGADEFILDWRYRDPGDAHTVTDLDFAEGDTLTVRFFASHKMQVADADGLRQFIDRADVAGVNLAGALVATLTDDTGATLDVALDGWGTLAGADMSDGDTEIPRDDTAPDTAGTKILGSPGDDTLIGGAGDDTILMRKGSDIATGGMGADEFILDWRYRDPGDAHTVTDLDFTAGDTLLIRFFDGGQIVVSDSAGLYALAARSDVAAYYRPGAVDLTLTDTGGDMVDLTLWL